MTEQKRLQRNQEKLNECYPAFRTRVEAALKEMSAMGFRPRIQEAWRSPEDQLKAYENGYSKLKFGFHNVTSEDGEPESLGVDVLDDNNPLTPPTRYLLALAITAGKQKLTTGITWGLPANLREAVSTAIQTGDIEATVKVGWDPTHIQPADITLVEVKEGKRHVF